MEFGEGPLSGQSALSFRNCVNFVPKESHMSDQSQDSLEDLALRFKAVVDTAIDGIITIDSVGIVETINEAGANLFGYEPHEIIGRNIKMLMPTPHREKHDGYIDNYKKTGDKRIIGIGRVVDGLKKNGTEFPFRLAVSEVLLRNRRIFTGIIHDLTKEKEAENQLLQLNQNLEKRVEERTEELAEAINKLLLEVQERKSVEAALRTSQQELKQALSKEKELNELKSRFVSMASHEFRTPLSTILSSAGLLGRYTLSEQQLRREKHIEKIKASVKNLTNILEDFLSLSKLEENKVSFNPQAHDFNDFCHKLIEDIQPLLKKDQQLAYEGFDEERSFHFDKRLLRNSLINLLTNASKYSEEGQSIRIKATTEKDHLNISVIDQGMGIPTGDQTHLFTRFFRAKNAINIKGTGLGLTILQRYMDLMKGRISFESRQGEGSTFTLHIPIHST